MTSMPHAEYDLNDAVAVLERTPASLSALLDGLPARWVTATEGEGTWSPYDVVGHLINADRTNWIPRARHILAGETGPFPPFDRTAHLREGRGRSISELLAGFAELRKESVAALLGLRLTRAELGRTGMHDALGEVRLSQLLATWVVHDLTHLAQVVRTMAKAYGSAVGPWSEYLSILRDRE
jgi:hypothetical protein